MNDVTDKCIQVCLWLICLVKNTEAGCRALDSTRCFAFEDLPRDKERLEAEELRNCWTDSNQFKFKFNLNLEFKFDLI